tara:strand:- start:3125 stop:3874 length:750 start_codon:yes stop_codon:yes gene_type:complete
VCADANAAARFQAKQRWLDKNAKYYSAGIKYFNREAGYKKSLQDNVIGFSRATSDAYSKAVYARGSAMKQTESLMKNYFRKQKVNQGGRARSFRRSGELMNLLFAKGQLRNKVRNQYGRNQALAYQGNLRKKQSMDAKNRKTLGFTPEYGAPVMMPQSDRFSTFLNFGLQVGSIIAAASSDIKEKENITYVGSSPQGHNIWEFNYTGHPQRYRGAMAQEVAKINPMAVGIQDGSLTVDYSKIDVDMVEV